MENMQLVLMRINSLSDLSGEFKAEAIKLFEEHIKTF